MATMLQARISVEPCTSLRFVAGSCHQSTHCKVLWRHTEHVNTVHLPWDLACSLSSSAKCVSSSSSSSCELICIRCGYNQGQGLSLQLDPAVLYHAMFGSHSQHAQALCVVAVPEYRNVSAQRGFSNELAAAEFDMRVWR